MFINPSLRLNNAISNVLLDTSNNELYENGIRVANQNDINTLQNEIDNIPGGNPNALTTDTPLIIPAQGSVIISDGVSSTTTNASGDLVVHDYGVIDANIALNCNAGLNIQSLTSQPVAMYMNGGDNNAFYIHNNEASRTLFSASSSYDFDNDIKIGNISSTLQLLLNGVDIGAQINTNTDAINNNLIPRVNTLERRADSQTGQISYLTAISQQSQTDITTLQGQVGTNTFDIIGLQNNVSQNTTNISTLQGDVSTNTHNIIVLQGDLNNLATYTSDSVSSLQGDVSTLQGQVSTNTTDISQNKLDISSNTTNITTLQGQVSTNTSNIATNTSNIATNTSNIGTNTSNIATNTSNIATNTSNIATNTSNIATNTSNIATNTTDISQNKLDISSNTLAIATINGKLKQNLSNYYVSTSGNDTTGDGTVYNPWATINKAVNVLNILVGDINAVINVAPGNYATASIVVTKSGISIIGANAISTVFTGNITFTMGINTSGYSIGNLSNISIVGTVFFNNPHNYSNSFTISGIISVPPNGKPCLYLSNSGAGTGGDCTVNNSSVFYANGDTTPITINQNAVLFMVGCQIQNNPAILTYTTQSYIRVLDAGRCNLFACSLYNASTDASVGALITINNSIAVATSTTINSCILLFTNGVATTTGAIMNFTNTANIGTVNFYNNFCKCFLTQNSPNNYIILRSGTGTVTFAQGNNLGSSTNHTLQNTGSGFTKTTFSAVV